MRLWSLHPRYLDAAGLVALWREALLAQAVLHGASKGYQHHPQLERFRAHATPLEAMSAYLRPIWSEATQRGYAFNAAKIFHAEGSAAPVAVSDGQRDYEWQHLRGKLERRSPLVLANWKDVQAPELHPLFTLEPGPMAPWERPQPQRNATEREETATPRKKSD